MKFYELFDEKYLKPIPKYNDELQNWEQIEIEDSNEPLVSIVGVDPKIEVQPQYYLNGVKGASEAVLVRLSIKEKLINIANKLPRGYKLLIWDAYRTLETQISLYGKYYFEFKNTKDIPECELTQYTKKFVSLPSYDKTRPAPHNTGAAVDLTICDKDGNPINFGTYFDDFEEVAYTNYYEELLNNKGSLTDEENEILFNRRILYNLFAEEGFANYPYEIWHKSYGDQMWSKLNNKEKAIYGSFELKSLLEDEIEFRKKIINYEYEQFMDGQKYAQKIGNMPVIFTAVHTMEQIRRDGSLKYSEPFTKGIALYVANNLDASYYIKMVDTGIDSNSSIEDEFKITLLDIIKKNNIKLLIDLHGARADREFDVELGTLNHLTADFSTIKELEDAFRENGVTRIVCNDPFKGGGITKYIYQNTDIDVIQIEINQNFRAIENAENIEKICKSLISFAQMYSKF